LQPDVTQLTRQSCVALRLRPYDIDELESSPAVNAKILQVLAEEAEAFAKRKIVIRARTMIATSALLPKNAFDRVLGCDPAALGQITAIEREGEERQLPLNHDAEALFRQQTN